MKNLQSPLPPTFRAGVHEIVERKKELRRKRPQTFLNKHLGKIILVIIVSFIYWFFNPHGVFVLGDPLSVYRYRVVLNDLKNEMPAEYDLVKSNIDVISIAYFMTGNKAGTAQEGHNGEKRIRLLENTLIQGPGYAHSTLVHEACHGLQFEKKLPFSPFCERQSREHACNQWGIRVLKKFNAKPEMIEHYERISRGKTVYGNSCERNGTLESMPEL